jgi:hypothetical protein
MFPRKSKERKEMKEKKLVDGQPVSVEPLRVTWELPILDLAALMISLLSLLVSLYVTFHVTQIHQHVQAIHNNINDIHDNNHFKNDANNGCDASDHPQQTQPE